MSKTLFLDITHKARSKQMLFCNFPCLTRHIASFLSGRALISLAMTLRSVRTALQQGGFWKAVCLRDCKNARQSGAHVPSRARRQLRKRKAGQVAKVEPAVQSWADKYSLACRHLLVTRLKSMLYFQLRHALFYARRSGSCEPLERSKRRINECSHTMMWRAERIDRVTGKPVALEPAPFMCDCNHWDNSLRNDCDAACCWMRCKTVPDTLLAVLLSPRCISYCGGTAAPRDPGPTRSMFVHMNNKNDVQRMHEITRLREFDPRTLTRDDVLLSVRCQECSRRLLRMALSEVEFYANDLSLDSLCLEAEKELCLATFL